MKYSKSLWEAAYSSKKEEVKYLLQYFPSQININIVSHGVTPLWTAADNGNVEIVKLLIEHGANVHFKHESGQTSLWSAAGKGHSEVVTLLLQHGAHVNEKSHGCSPLYVAAQNNHLTTVKELIKFGGDVNLPYQVNGQTPLFKAAASNHLRIVKELIKAGANIHQPDNDGLTALHAAVSKGHTQTVEFLLESGANVHAETLSGIVPIHYARNLQMVSMLRKYGSSPDFSQSEINKLFANYLSHYPSLHPGKYTLIELDEIQGKVNEGMCYGYTLYHRFMRELGRYQELKDKFELIATWDGNIKTLETNTAVENALSDTLFNVLALHMSAPSRYTNKYNYMMDVELLKLVRSYETVFNIGFVFDNFEVKSLLDSILKENQELDISYFEKDILHIISLKKVNKNSYEVFNSNTHSFKPLIAHSLQDVVSQIKQTGLVLTLNLNAPSLKDKAFYSASKNTFINELIAKRLDHNTINMIDSFHLTSLFYSIYAKDKETVFKLIDNHASIKTEGKFFPPIYIAAQLNEPEIVQKLISMGIDANTRCEQNSLLHVAASLGHVNVVKVAIENKAEIDSINNNNVTPLYIACQNGYYDIAKMLIEKKADVNFDLPNGHSLLTAAIAYRHPDILKLLISHGADINKRILKDGTPISFAMVLGFIDMVEILVEAGANLANVKKSYSALEYARSLAKDDMISYLSSVDKSLQRPFAIQNERKHLPSICENNSKKNISDPQIKNTQFSNSYSFFSEHSKQGFFTECSTLSDVAHNSIKPSPVPFTSIVELGTFLGVELGILPKNTLHVMDNSIIANQNNEASARKTLNKHGISLDQLLEDLCGRNNIKKHEDKFELVKEMIIKVTNEDRQGLRKEIDGIAKKNDNRNVRFKALVKLAKAELNAEHNTLWNQITTRPW